MAEKKCGFPNDDFHFTENRAPCNERATAVVSIDHPQMSVIVDVCERHWYTALKLYPRDIVEMVRHRQFTGEYLCKTCRHPVDRHKGHCEYNIDPEPMNEYEACNCTALREEL